MAGGTVVSEREGEEKLYLVRLALFKCITELCSTSYNIFLELEPFGFVARSVVMALAFCR